MPPSRISFHEVTSLRKVGEDVPWVEGWSRRRCQLSNQAHGPSSAADVLLTFCVARRGLGRLCRVPAHHATSSLGMVLPIFLGFTQELPGIQELPGKVSVNNLCPRLQVRSLRHTRSADVLSC